MGILSLLAEKFRESDASRPAESPPRDPHGQAPLAAYRSEAVIDRQIDELIGLAKGVVAECAGAR